MILKAHMNKCTSFNNVMQSIKNPNVMLLPSYQPTMSINVFTTESRPRFMKLSYSLDL